MSSPAQRQAMIASRRRAAAKGLVRVEVLVPKRSVELVRTLAADLRRGAESGGSAAPPEGPVKPFKSIFEVFASDLPEEYFEGVFEEGPRTDTGRDIDF